MLRLWLLFGIFSLGVSLPRQYHFVNENKTWAEAQRYCRENYVDLASINNTDENLALTDKISIWNSSRTWIGLYDDLNSWKWSLGDDSFYKEGDRSFRNWHIEKPNYFIGNSKCVYLYTYDGVWRVTSCSSGQQFICFDGRLNASVRYIPVNQYMSWTEAQRYCREHYTDLASVRNQSENQKIRTLASVSDSNSYISYRFWIGLYRTRSWSDNSTSSFRNWKYGEPYNYIQGEFCTTLLLNDDDYYNGRWTDERCVGTFPFVCYSTNSSTSSRQYHFVNENKTWTEAQRYCREIYTDLATIDSMEEVNTLINTVNGSYSGLAWIGLYDELDSWRWSLDNDTFYQEGERDFRGWRQQPDNYNGNEFCVYINSDGTWYDGNCRANLPFVCYDGTNGLENYTIINQRMPWTEAQHYCREYYTDLASVRNQSDNLRILNLTGGSVAWIGLYRTRVWSDKQESTYENWRPASYEEPDNGFNVRDEFGNQHCTAVSFRDSGHWTDENCFSTFPFICYKNTCTGSACTLHQYHFVNENKTWTEAQRLCRENYTDLATIDNMEEMYTLLNTVNGSTGLAWIGLYDDLNSWKWSLDDSIFYEEGQRSFRNWYIHKPWYWYEQNTCVYLTGYRMYWWPTLCSAELPFICFDGRVTASERYIPVYQKMNWTEAQRYCREHFTDLTSVRNQTENQKIRLSIDGYFYNHDYYDGYDYYYYFRFWIGLYRTSSWSDQSNHLFSNWKPGHPNNYGQDKFCTAVLFNHNNYYYDNGKWTDENCAETFPFLCYSTNSSTSYRQYHFINENKTWTEAQRYCRENYTDLATIDNMEEVNALNSTVNGSYSGLAWIGLYVDLDDWKWSLDNDTFYQEGERDFRGWPQQPDNYLGNEFCVSMNKEGKWFDNHCTDRKSFVCYNDLNNTYLVINDGKTWEEAQRFCRENSTDLASVRNEAELRQIQSIMNSYDTWIGLYRNRLWSDQSNSTFTYWRSASPEPTPEPDNGENSYGQRGNQHCAAVDHSGQWTDENCFASFPFICYTAFTSGAAMGLRLKITANANLLNSQIEGLVLMELQQELVKLGLSKNVTVDVRNIDQLDP